MQHFSFALQPVTDIERKLRESDGYWVIDAITRKLSCVAYFMLHGQQGRNRIWSQQYHYTKPQFNDYSFQTLRQVPVNLFPLSLTSCYKSEKWYGLSCRCHVTRLKHVTYRDVTCCYFLDTPQLTYIRSEGRDLLYVSSWYSFLRRYFLVQRNT
jgi:hypothetical protein